MTIRKTARWCGLACAILVGLTAPPAVAIPSPELIIGSISSLSQAVTLLTAMLGGSAALVGVRSGKTSRWARTWASALALVCLASLALNGHQWLERKEEKAARLTATLQRPAYAPGLPKLGPALEDLSYGQQLKHPMGLATAAAAQLLLEHARGEHPETIFIDVRETAETEMGSIADTLAVRYPDFAASHVVLTNKNAVLFCDNGSRSHNICEALAALGIPCQFMIGGLEKWVAEKRPVTGISIENVADLRTVSPYQNQRTLLNTQQVHDLLQNQHTVFIDTRNTGEFAASHLPNAINLPIHWQSTAQYKSQIASLPQRPVILPCYDGRGCFYAELLGLELTRAGHNVRGRYTVPMEYFVTPNRPAYVEQWVADNQQSLWTSARNRVALIVAWLMGQTGLPVAILLIATLSRLAILPLSLKAERDQIIARRLKPAVAAIKAQTEADAPSRARAMTALYHRHGLTPVRNLLAMLFIPIMALATAGIHQAAASTRLAWAWIPDLAQRDPTWILPSIFGSLIAAYLHLSIAHTNRQRILIWCLIAPALAATALQLGSAVDLYLIVSAILMLIQRALVIRQSTPTPRQHRSLRTLWRRLRLPQGVISLGDIERLAGRGNKAYRLGKLKAVGTDVPDGLLLTHNFLERLGKQTAKQRKRTLNRLWRHIDASTVAVRSSAAAEDGHTQSFAGVFESELHVDRPTLEKAIERIKSSFTSERAASYGIAPESGNILLQTMIDAEYSGVLFTRDPGSPGAMLIELVAGTADALVSGTVTPTAFRFGRYSLAPMGAVAAPIALKTLLEIGQRAEALFTRPQDIEWTYHHGNFQIVQSRDITQTLTIDAEDEVLQSEWHRVLDRVAGSDAATIVLAQTELSEVLPRPTPLSFSIMESLWAVGGSVDRACQKIGLDYRVDDHSPSYLVSVVGRLYIDKRQEKARATRVSQAIIRRLEAAASQIERDFREHFLPAFTDRMTVLDAVAFERMDVPQLQTTLQNLQKQFVQDTHVEVDIINIAAHFYQQRARSALEQLGLDPALCLAGAPLFEATRALIDAGKLSGAARLSDLQRTMRHRSVIDYELAEPRYLEEAQALEALCEANAALATSSRHAAADHPRLLSASVVIRQRVERARKFQALKEDAKHHSLREYSTMRRVVLALDHKLSLDGLSFFLTVDELVSLRDETADQLRITAAHRREMSRIFAHVAPPRPALTLCDIERAANPHLGREIHDASALVGTRVSGSHVVEGRCYQVSALDSENGAALIGFLPGDIIVARLFHPAWLPYLRHCSGIVCELGGWLSHMALLAREHNIPMIVGVQTVTRLTSGTLLRLHKDGRVEPNIDPAIAAIAANAAQ